MNSRVDPEVICGPLSETASRIGRAGSSTVGSMGRSWWAVMEVSRPSVSSASVKPSCTWVEVSSTLTISVIHFRETRSSIASTAIPAAGKCVVS
jgi:hypothetical protein